MKTYYQIERNTLSSIHRGEKKFSLLSALSKLNLKAYKSVMAFYNEIGELIVEEDKTHSKYVASIKCIKLNPKDRKEFFSEQKKRRKSALNSFTAKGHNLFLSVVKQNKPVKYVESLLKEGARASTYELNASRMSALMWAAKNNNPKMVHLLLNNGASLDRKSGEQKSALDYAFENKNPYDVILALLDAGLDVNTPIKNRFQEYI